jgi:hypothetical protein
MSKRKKAPKPDVVVYDLSKQKGRLKRIGGSMSDDWNNIIANQTCERSGFLKAPTETKKQQRYAAVSALVSIAPRDEFEGMITAQLIASHNAAMECYRRAMLPEQPFEGWREQLSQANKLSRTYATLLEALNRHRGKGQQKVTVEHVHVHEGGQAIVGNVQAPGGWGSPPIKGSTRCKAAYRCTSANGVVHGHDAGHRVSRPR